MVFTFSATDLTPVNFRSVCTNHITPLYTELTALHAITHWASALEMHTLLCSCPFVERSGTLPIPLLTRAIWLVVHPPTHVSFKHSLLPILLTLLSPLPTQLHPEPIGRGSCSAIFEDLSARALPGDGGELHQPTDGFGSVLRDVELCGECMHDEGSWCEQQGGAFGVDVV